MPEAHLVNANDWDNLTILFDNEVYSVVVGDYTWRNSPRRRAVGQRWNGEPGRQGFPLDSHRQTAWLVVPSTLHGGIDLEVPLLHGLLYELARNPDRQLRESPMDNLQTAAERQRRIRAELARIHQQHATATSA